MKFETCYDMANIANMKNAEITWFGTTDAKSGYDLHVTYECDINEVPFWVSRFDIHSIIFDSYVVHMSIFLNADETNFFWNKVSKLA